MFKVCFFEPWLRFKHPLVRQLAFCIASPNILTSVPCDLTIENSFELHCDTTWSELYTRYESRLLELDQDPQALIDFLAQLRSTRLGLRFEYLLWFWLQDRDFHPYQLLGHSLQQIEDSKTLGELDFLILNTQTQQIEHWEVALKFYLGEGELNLSQWYGLNRQDTLQRKLQHFTDRQFQFTEVDHYSIQRKFAIVKGQLYLPHQQDQCIIPEWVNSKRRLAQWGSYIPETSYYRLQRHEWLCPDHSMTSAPAQWWTNGLYHSISDTHVEPAFYMYRQPSLLKLF